VRKVTYALFFSFLGQMALFRQSIKVLIRRQDLFSKKLVDGGGVTHTYLSCEDHPYLTNKFMKLGEFTF
jgi:hypothetical protein